MSEKKVIPKKVVPKKVVPKKVIPKKVVHRLTRRDIALIKAVLISIYDILNNMSLSGKFTCSDNTANALFAIKGRIDPLCEELFKKENQTIHIKKNNESNTNKFNLNDVYKYFKKTLYEIYKKNGGLSIEDLVALNKNFELFESYTNKQIKQNNPK